MVVNAQKGHLLPYIFLGKSLRHSSSIRYQRQHWNENGKGIHHCSFLCYDGLYQHLFPIPKLPVKEKFTSPFAEPCDYCIVDHADQDIVFIVGIIRFWRLQELPPSAPS